MQNFENLLNDSKKMLNNTTAGTMLSARDSKMLAGI